MRSQRSYFQCLNRDFQIINGACRRCKMQNVMKLARQMDKLRNIVVIKFKVWKLKKVFNVAEVACDQIIHGDNLVAFFEEPVREMGAQKSRPSRNQYSFFTHK